MFKLFEFKEGKLTTLPDISSGKIRGFIFGSIILLIVIFLSGWLKIDEKELWKLYNLIIQQFGLTQDIPKIENEKERDARIELEVDKAIRDYERLTGDYRTPRIPLPRLIERPLDTSKCYTEECKKLGGEMRLCAPWVDDCSKQ
jgi:hypothetical protein